MKIYKDIEQGTDEWLKLRAGVITGTKLKSVIGNAAVQKTVMYELIAEEFAPLEESFTSPAMQRGNDLEPIAKAKYADITGYEVEEIGFIKKNDYIGLSPDGIIVNQEQIIKKAFEIKCPGHKNFVRYILENKIPAEYKAQVIHYFVVIDDLQELDFVLYNPDFYIEEQRLKIITVTRKELQEDIEKAKEKIRVFRKKWLESISLLLHTEK